MTETEKDLKEMAVKISENESRSKSNTHQIDEIKSTISEMQSEQKAIYKISTSIELMAQNLTTMKDDISELKQGQENLGDKVDEKIQGVKKEVGDINKKVAFIENQPAMIVKKRYDKIVEKLLWLLIGGMACGILYQFIPFFMG